MPRQLPVHRGGYGGAWAHGRRKGVHRRNGPRAPLARPCHAVAGSGRRCPPKCPPKWPPWWPSGGADRGPVPPGPLARPGRPVRLAPPIRHPPGPFARPGRPGRPGRPVEASRPLLFSRSPDPEHLRAVSRRGPRSGRVAGCGERGGASGRCHGRQAGRQAGSRADGQTGRQVGNQAGSPGARASADSALIPCRAPLRRPSHGPRARRHQPRRCHSGRCGRSSPSVVSSPWPG